jgi:hypothetical protein
MRRRSRAGPERTKSRRRKTTAIPGAEGHAQLLHDALDRSKKPRREHQERRIAEAHKLIDELESLAKEFAEAAQRWPGRFSRSLPPSQGASMRRLRQQGLIGRWVLDNIRSTVVITWCHEGGREITAEQRNVGGMGAVCYGQRAPCAGAGEARHLHLGGIDVGKIIVSCPVIPATVPVKLDAVSILSVPVPAAKVTTPLNSDLMSNVAPASIVSEAVVLDPVVSAVAESRR